MRLNRPKAISVGENVALEGEDGSLVARMAISITSPEIEGRRRVVELVNPRVANDRRINLPSGRDKSAIRRSVSMLLLFPPFFSSKIPVIFTSFLLAYFSM